jgi:hypothetical protein
MDVQQVNAARSSRPNRNDRRVGHGAINNSTGRKIQDEGNAASCQLQIADDKAALIVVRHIFHLTILMYSLQKLVSGHSSTNHAETTSLLFFYEDGAGTPTGLSCGMKAPLLT